MEKIIQLFSFIDNNIFLPEKMLNPEPLFACLPGRFLQKSLLQILLFCFSGIVSGQYTITGRVVSEGKPVKTAHVYYEPEYRSTVTDDDGYFSLPSPAKGNVRIVVFHPEFVGISVNLKAYKGDDPISLARLIYKPAPKEISDLVTKEYLADIFAKSNVLYSRHELSLSFEYSGMGFKGERPAGSLTGTGLCILPSFFRDKIGESQDVKIYFKSYKSGGFTLEPNRVWVSDDYRKSKGELNFLYYSFYNSTLQSTDKTFFSRMTVRVDSVTVLNGETLIAVSYFYDRKSVTAFSVPQGKIVLNLSQGKILHFESMSLAGMVSVARFAFNGKYMSINEIRLTNRGGNCIPYYSRYIGPGEGRLLISQSGGKEVPQYIDHRLTINTIQPQGFTQIQKMGYKYIEPWKSLLLLR